MSTEWITLAKDFGFPVVLIGVLLYGLYGIGKWLAEHIVKPLVATHLRFIEESGAAQKSIVATLVKLEETTSKMYTVVKTGDTKLDRLIGESVTSLEGARSGERK